MDIGELNSRIIIKTHAVTQNATTGRAESSLTDSWTRWAKVVQDSSSRTLESLAITYKEAYTITKRFEASRPTPKTATITLGAKVLTIGSVVKKDVGRAWYEIITAYTTQ